jgi:hypothetical protein
MKTKVSSGYVFLIKKINDYTKTEEYKGLSKNDRKEIKEVEVYLFNLASLSGELGMSQYYS